MKSVFTVFQFHSWQLHVPFSNYMVRAFLPNSSAPSRVVWPPMNPEAWIKMQPSIPHISSKALSRRPLHWSGSARLRSNEWEERGTLWILQLPFESGNILYKTCLSEFSNFIFFSSSKKCSFHGHPPSVNSSIWPLSWTENRFSMAFTTCSLWNEPPKKIIIENNTNNNRIVANLPSWPPAFCKVINFIQKLFFHQFHSLIKSGCNIFFYLLFIPLWVKVANSGAQVSGYLVTSWPIMSGNAIINCILWNKNKNIGMHKLTSDKVKF